MAVTGVADVGFLRRRKNAAEAGGKRQKVKAEDASIAHADLRIDDLRQRVRRLENVKAVVTVRTRPAKS